MKLYGHIPTVMEVSDNELVASVFKKLPRGWERDGRIDRRLIRRAVNRAN